MMRDGLRGCMLAGVVAAAGVSATAQQADTAQPHHWTIVVHGGAGVIERSALGPKGDTAYRASLRAAKKAETDSAESEEAPRRGPGRFAKPKPAPAEKTPKAKKTKS